MRRLPLLLLALALVATACSTTSQVAATVDGEEITVADVQGLVPGESDILDENQMATLLFNLITDSVVRTSAEQDFSISVDEDEFDTEREALITRLTAQGQTLEEVLEANDATESLLDIVVNQQILIQDVNEALLEDAGPPTEDEIELEFELQKGALTNVCASHILLESQDEAQAALDRAIAGEAFADLAVELSTGPSGPEGGDLGCTSPDAYVPEFASAVREAEVGEPTGPVESEFGFHVILVTERTEPTLEDTRDNLVATIDQRRLAELFESWRNEALADADVEVDEAYGTWVLEPVPNVMPPGV
jgi:parvulin-like peptidyl-prolyl isomerase